MKPDDAECVGGKCKTKGYCYMKICKTKTGCDTKLLKRCVDQCDNLKGITCDKSCSNCWLCRKGELNNLDSIDLCKHMFQGKKR